MKTHAQLITITEEMANKELVDALNKNFLELKESSENRDQVMLNAIGELQKDVNSLKKDVNSLKTDVGSLKTDVGSLKTDVNSLKTDVGSLKYEIARIIDHLSGRKLLTED